MPKMQDLDEVASFVDSVIDQYRCVNQFAEDTPAFTHHGANVPEALQQINEVKNGVTESLGITRKLRPGVG